MVVDRHLGVGAALDDEATRQRGWAVLLGNVCDGQGKKDEAAQVAGLGCWQPVRLACGGRSKFTGKKTAVKKLGEEGPLAEEGDVMEVLARSSGSDRDSERESGHRAEFGHGPRHDMLLSPSAQVMSAGPAISTRLHVGGAHCCHCPPVASLRGMKAPQRAPTKTVAASSSPKTLLSSGRLAHPQRLTTKHSTRLQWVCD